MRTDAPQTRQRVPARDRHSSLTEGLTCEPLLAVPLALSLLALATFVAALLQDDPSGPATRYWTVACLVFVTAHVGFVAVYDSPRRHAARVARGCAHIRPGR